MNLPIFSGETSPTSGPQYFTFSSGSMCMMPGPNNRGTSRTSYPASDLPSTPPQYPYIVCQTIKTRTL